MTAKLHPSKRWKHRQAPREPTQDLVAIYRERLKGSESALEAEQTERRLRAFEFVVNHVRWQKEVDLETAKAAVTAALAKRRV